MYLTPSGKALKEIRRTPGNLLLALKTQTAMLRREPYQEILAASKR